MNLKNKNCQSCGMPLKQDPKGGGTNSDGTINTTYCGDCFKDGIFRQPNWTVQRMQNFVKEEMKERSIPEFMTVFLREVFQNLNVGEINEIIKAGINSPKKFIVT